MSMFQGVATLQAYLREHRGVYLSVNFNKETKRIDGANQLVKELTGQNVIETLETAAPYLADGLKNVAKIVGFLGRAGDHLGLGTDLLVAFGCKEKRVMQELDELSKNISLVDQEIAKPSLLTQSTSLWRFWLIHDKVLSAVLHFEQSAAIHNHHPIPGSDRDREMYCKRLGHMVRDYSPTQVINDLLLIHSIIMGETGCGKPLFMQLAEEAYALENEELDKFLGPFFFFFQSVVALQVRAIRMLLSFIMYEQEDALYERDLMAIASNVVQQLERSNPVSEFKWYINFKVFGEQNALIVSDKWPGWYAYMAGGVIGNLQGRKGHPGDQGIFKIEPHHGGTFKITSRRWRNYYVYMDSSGLKNVRVCKGDPGNQGYWNFNFSNVGKRTFTLTTVEYPNSHVHMASNPWASLSGKRGNLDDSCYFQLIVEPITHGANGVELSVFNQATQEQS